MIMPPKGKSLKTNLPGRSRGEMAVARRPAGGDLTAFFLAVYSFRFNNREDVKLTLDAQA
jgi:hypothetical protein